MKLLGRILLALSAVLLAARRFDALCNLQPGVCRHSEIEPQGILLAAAIVAIFGELLSPESR